MSKSKRQSAGVIERPLSDQRKQWWFADQSEINQLITSAIDGDGDDKRALRMYMDFIRRGYAELGPLIPVRLASASIEITAGNGLSKLTLSEVSSYPTILSCLEDFLDAKPVLSGRNDADIIAYVAATNNCGMKTGEVLLCDAARPWDFNGDKFVGLTLYYRKGVE